MFRVYHIPGMERIAYVESLEAAYAVLRLTRGGMAIGDGATKLIRETQPYTRTSSISYDHLASSPTIA